jgi:hypothetical protein
MRPRSLGYDPLSGIEVIFHDDEGDGFTIEHRQDVEVILEGNKIMRENCDPGNYRKTELGWIARVPWVKIMELAKQGFITPAGDILDERKYKKWLNSSDGAPYRVRGGVV